jgi:membrane-associated protease RseP (regulator of RpoE activity)
LVDVTAIFVSRTEILLRAEPVVHHDGIGKEIESRLSNLGYRAEVLTADPRLVIRLRALEVADSREPFPWINLILFFGTILTTLLAGAFWQGVDYFSNPRLLLSPVPVFRAGLPFSISLLLILLFHEFGHYIAARLNKVNVTLPYFVPAPTIIGTFGAFIRSKSAFMNRRQLLDVAAAGPLAGLIVAIIVLVIGTNGSHFGPIPQQSGGYISFGESLLQKFITILVKGPTPQNQVLMINSIALAGWVGLLVTMFNLLPIGQLDGGHIMYALFGKTQKTLAYAAMAGLLILSYWWNGWAFWLILTLILKPVHPPTLIDEIPLGRGRKAIGYISIVAFILCFMPVPIG